MTEITKRCESMLFNYETTYRTDYRGWEFKPAVKTSYKVKTTRSRGEYVPLKDIHALMPWRDPNVPFDLFHKPLEIIRTSPWRKQEPHEPPIDEEREEVQKTRPRVYMTPALPLDNVEEPTRQEFINHIYKSVVTKAMEETVALVGTRDLRAPLLGNYAPATPITIEPLLDPYVSPEWRMPSVGWDNRQLRTYTSPTKTFWMSRTPNCAERKTSAARKAMMKMTRR